jgi:hypothetical protein
MDSERRTVNAHSHDGDGALGGLVGGFASGTGDFGVVDVAAAIALATPGKEGG